MAEIITTRSKPRRNIFGEGLSSPNSVRAYRCSPEDINLQIRREKDYISVSLTLAEAIELAETLKAAAYE